jgi:hypothetical protein
LEFGFGEVVDGTIDRLGSWDKRNFVVDVGAMRRELVGILFVKDVGEFGIFGGYLG